MPNDIDISQPKPQINDFIHDLRTPVTSINGFAELMLDDKAITGSSREYLQIILDESARMSAIVREFSKAIENEG